MKNNPLNFYTRAEVEFFGKPFFTGKRWLNVNHETYTVLLTRSRCRHFGYPVEEDEVAAAYRYAVHGPADRKYVPVFDRSRHELPMEKVYENEVFM